MTICHRCDRCGEQVWPDEVDRHEHHECPKRFAESKPSPVATPLPPVDERTGEVWQPVPDFGDRRVELLAELVHLREDPPAHPAGSPVWKGLYLVERADGSGRFKAWGTVPRGFFVEERRAKREHGPSASLRGSLVTLKAKVTPSTRDDCFGFLNRPTQPIVLQWGKEGRR